MDMFREWKRGDCQIEVMKWSPPGRRKRGRPKLTWTEGIRGVMGEKGLMEEDWNDRDKMEEDKIIVKWAHEECGSIVQPAKYTNNTTEKKNYIIFVIRRT